MSILRYKKFLLADGGVLRMGGGSGGGGTTVNQSNTNIPEYARPYVEEMLGRAGALTDTNQNPYQSYGGQRIADFNALQKQAFGNVANMTTSGQLGTGTNLATQAGQGSLGLAGQMAGAGQNYANMATDPNAVKAYMNPYIQGALQPQLNQLAQQAGIQSAGQQGAATQAGAFGGSRSALANSLAQQNGLMAQQAALGQGYDQAFKAAQQAQQFGANLGLQGQQGALSAYGQANSAANTLGQLGQEQFNQQRNINQDQQTTGAVQQAQAQQALDQKYQDWANQLKYPYEQLGFMSDMLRGLPMSQSTNNWWSPGPSTASQLGGLGLAGLGIYGMSGGFRAKGGVVKAANGGLMAAKRYQAGGMPQEAPQMTSEQIIKRLYQMLKDPNLDPMQAAQIKQKIAVYTRMMQNPETGKIMAPAEGGISSIPTGNMVPEQMAGGGIALFSNGGSSDKYRDWLEKQVRASTEKQLGENAFSKSEAEKAKLEAALAARQENAPWEALTMAGLGAAAGQSPHALSNFGAGAFEGFKNYAKTKGSIASDREKLLDAQLYADRYEDARNSALTGQMNTTLGHLYARDAARAVAGAGSEDKSLFKAIALMERDPMLKDYIAKRKTLKEGTPEYEVNEKRIAERQNDIYDFLGIKNAPAKTSRIPDYVTPKETGFWEGIFGSKKPVPFSQLPATKG